MRPKIKIADFDYSLPQERIAKFPLENRSASKLLVYDFGRLFSGENRLENKINNINSNIINCSNNNKILDNYFYDLPKFLPKSSLLIFNQTKVVPARLYFKKATGAIIEILCLAPSLPKEYVLSFASKGSCSWNVIVRNVKKWKGGEIFLATDNVGKELNLRALLTGRPTIQEEDSFIYTVKFTWDGDYTFSEVLDICGSVPIPPYLNRESEEVDKSRYQTVYAKYEGSVAAPTAGLHFTDELIASIQSSGVEIGKVCLHVGAGTFKPVTTEYIAEHPMHCEPFSITKELLNSILKRNGHSPIISVGTTSCRTLESLYYIGVHCIEDGEEPQLNVNQWEPYDREYQYTTNEALEAILAYMERKNLSTLYASTSIIIVPSFKFRLVELLITNFHQPHSTLLLLIAAFVGEGWRNIYNHALDNGYRFLSYGDSSLLFRGNI